MEIVTDLIFLGSKIAGDGDAAMNLKDVCSLEQSFTSSHVQIRELDHKVRLSTRELMLLNYVAGEDP